MTVSNSTATAGRPAARLTLDGPTARRFRRELLGGYESAAHNLQGSLRDLNAVDFDGLDRAKHRLDELGEILNAVGWSREIDDSETVEFVGDADLLIEGVCAFIADAAQRLQEKAESYGLDEVIDAYGDVERWYKILGKAMPTIGEDL